MNQNNKTNKYQKINNNKKNKKLSKIQIKMKNKMKNKKKQNHYLQITSQILRTYNQKLMNKQLITNIYKQKMIMNLLNKKMKMLIQILFRKRKIKKIQLKQKRKKKNILNQRKNLLNKRMKLLNQSYLKNKNQIQIFQTIIKMSKVMNSELYKGNSYIRYSMIQLLLMLNKIIIIILLFTFILVIYILININNFAL